MLEHWQFWIDVGGTFTDCIGIAPTGELRQFKTLSSGITKGTIQAASNSSFSDSLRTTDPPRFWNGATCRLFSKNSEVLATATVTSFEASTATFTLTQPISSDNAVAYELDLGLPAPILAIRWLLKLSPHDPCPVVRIRFGTTRGTNALLTRNGANTALITTKGFGDVPLIGNQDRPDLFAFNIYKPEPLFSQAFEVDERISADGTILKPLPANTLPELQPSDFDSVAVCLMNAYCNPIHEQQLESMLRHRGFHEISVSSEVSPLIRFVPRCDTTVMDAYLNPVLRKYMHAIRKHLPGSEIQVMTSTGGLVDSHSFRGRDCILSGPAGGIVGFSKVARAEGFDHAIGFDMGGTSTDVARYTAKFEFENETTKAGVRIMSPGLGIETVAAGGGSICGFDGTRLFVGPQSAGAAPGPACYGAGGPLTVTDLNVYLGRVLLQHFPFHLNRKAIEQRLQQLRDSMLAADVLPTESPLQELAEGLLQIANDNMVQAIRKVSVAKGYHPADFVLVSFGGAGGQHACSVARSLGIRTVLIHPFAGILSAYGIGLADVRAIRQASILLPLNAATIEQIKPKTRQLAGEAIREVQQQGIPADQLLPTTLSLQLRYVGTDSALMIQEPASFTFREAFEREHQRLFGYRRPSKDVEVASIRVEVVGRASHTFTTEANDSRSIVNREAAMPLSSDVWFEGKNHSTKLVFRDSLFSGDRIDGPAIICEPTSTVIIEPNCTALITDSGTIQISIGSSCPDGRSTTDAAKTGKGGLDPVLLEVFNNQFVSIAEQMGETLRRTSTSTNVRERLDFSCAMFDKAGQLVVNAPHVPVHLGAMGETVRAIISDHTHMHPGDVFVTNDPYRGGSHLPDVTVITPVFIEVDPNTGKAEADEIRRDVVSRGPAFYVANRAHHAEIGGIVPGSMPPFSKNLAEEGVLIRSRKLVNAGQSCEDEIRDVLASGKYPSRCIEDNLADLSAQVAANECGVQLLRNLTAQHSVSVVQDYMQHIQTTAAKKMRRCLLNLRNGRHSFHDKLDDGTQINVTVIIDNDTATVDFSGTDGVHRGNLNANRAITTSAVLYCFRCLLNEPVPLNAGLLEPVRIIIPAGLLNPPPGMSPETSPAIVGGNVETSQRIVDVLLGALNLTSASQGTMNNLTFGDQTFGYYETICGGAGATPTANGADAVHTHMTNTRLTDPEVLEQRYPVRLRQFSIRRNSGGAGQFHGGNGIVRELELLRPLRVSMLSQRRGTNAPYGINGGNSGCVGCNSIAGKDIGGSFSLPLDAGTVLMIETPGGGGCGIPENE